MGGWVADSYVTSFSSEISSFITVGNLNHRKVTQFNVTKRSRNYCFRNWLNIDFRLIY